MRKEVERLAKQYKKYIKLYRKEDERAEDLEETLWEAINSDLSLTTEEIMFLASHLLPGEMDDLTNDFIGFLVRSPEFKNTNVFILDNFGDALLELKMEAICIGSPYKFSVLSDNSENIALDNFWMKVNEVSPNFTNVDIDYILAMVHSGKAVAPDSVDMEEVSKGISDAIKKNKYRYKSYFEDAGLEALQELGINSGKKNFPKIVLPKDYDPFRFY